MNDKEKQKLLSLIYQLRFYLIGYAMPQDDRKTYNIIDRNLTSIEKQIKKL